MEGVMVKRSKGFTLIEIIIVIVIIGVLATLALPKITGQIEASRAAEAMSMLGTIKRAAEQCVDLAGAATADFTNCAKFDQLGMSATLPSGSLFTYYATGASGSLKVRAVRSALAGTPTICMDYIPASTSPVGFGYNSVATGNPYAGIVTRTSVAPARAVISACGDTFATTLMTN
jgi:prepilin-type N-terminal cleavage/methylation domain-containing protein